MADKTDILEIKSRLDIVQVITPYVHLKKAGRTWMGLCPFHTEKTPSFHVNPQLGMYKCFGCGKAGDIFTFIQDVEHVDFPEALDRLADMAGINLKKGRDLEIEKKTKRIKELLHQASDFYHYILLNHPLAENARKYTQKRGLKPETINQYKIGYAPRKYTLLQEYLRKNGFTKEEIVDAGLLNERKSDKFTDRLMFSLFDNSGHVVGFSGRVIDPGDIRPKYLNSPETVVFKKRFQLFGFYQAKDAISKKDAAILCEGQLDAISSQQSGVMNILAPLGTGLTESQLQLVSRLTQDVIFAFDNDTAGQKSIKRGVELALTLNLKPFIIQLPEDVKDIDELVQKDPIKWKDLAETPLEYFPYVFRKLAEVMKTDFSLFEQKLAAVLETISFATPLKKSLLLRECAQILGLDETVLAQTIAPKEQYSLVTERIKEKEKSRSIAEYVIQIMLLYPFLGHLLGKSLRVKRYFQNPVHRKVYDRIISFVMPYKKNIDIKLQDGSSGKSWSAITSDFMSQYEQNWKQLVYQMQEDPEISSLMISLQDETMVATIDLSDDMVRDFMSAKKRLRQLFLSLRISNLQRKLIASEATDNEEESDLLQKKLQKYLTSMRSLR